MESVGKNHTCKRGCFHYMLCSWIVTYRLVCSRKIPNCLPTISPIISTLFSRMSLRFPQFKGFIRYPISPVKTSQLRPPNFACSLANSLRVSQIALLLTVGRRKSSSDSGIPLVSMIAPFPQHEVFAPGSQGGSHRLFTAAHRGILRKEVRSAFPWEATRKNAGDSEGMMNSLWELH